MCDFRVSNVCRQRYMREIHWRRTRCSRTAAFCIRKRRIYAGDGVCRNAFYGIDARIFIMRALSYIHCGEKQLWGHSSCAAETTIGPAAAFRCER